MTQFSVVDTTDEHIQFVADYMQEQTKKEMKKLGFSPRAALEDSINNSYLSYSFLADDNVCSIFGLFSTNVIDRCPYAWITSSTFVEKHIKMYIKCIRFFSDQWLNNYDLLYGIIDKDYLQALRLFELCGFYEKNTIYYNGFPFIRVMKDKPYGR